MNSYDSDDESFTDELSPTDGYFNPRDRTQDTHIQVPSPSGTKADEARQNEQQFAASSPLSRGRRTVESHALSETSPLLDAGPPPPTYSAAIASPYPMSSSSRTEDESHVPLANYGSTNETSPLNARRAPESMAEPVEIEDGQPERRRWGRRGRSWLPDQMRRKIVHTLVASIGIVLMVLILVLVFTSNWSNRNDVDTPGTTLPTIPDHGEEDLPSRCALKAEAQERIFPFSAPEAFSFQEFIDNDGSIPGGLEGVVRVVPGAATQRHNLEVRLSYRTSDHYTIKHVHYAVTDTSLSIRTPEIARTKKSSSGKPCLGISVTISVAPGVELENLLVNSANFDLNIFAGLDTKILNTTDVTLVRGSLSSFHLESRKTVIDVVSGDVKGVFALRDLLSISTKSGTVDVSVDPKNASEIYPVPAESVFRSESGSITVGFPTSKSTSTLLQKGAVPGLWRSGTVPDRDFRTRVTTNSGDVRGIFLHGSSTTLRTSSGSIAASIHPLHAPSEKTTIDTASQSGDTAIDVSAPLFDSDVPLRHLSSSHYTESGKIQLEYPQAWEGDLRGVKGTGHVSLEGRQVEIITETWRSIHAKKGHGQSDLGFHSETGDIQVIVGDI
ncbi:MAG: hypothetical protein Q9165_003304 [Trypethelium subeluteriae]